MDTTLVGGAGADTYSATQATLTAGDVLSGSTGNDTLSITSTGGELGAGVISRLVENIRVTATGATTINGAQFDDVVSVENSGSTVGSAVTFSNLKAIPTINVNGANSNTSVGVAASVIAGTADAATVNLTSAANVGSVSVTADGIETINVVASGTSGAQDTTGDIAAGRTVTVASNALTTLNVTGTGSARIVADLRRATDTITGTVTSDAGSHSVEVAADSGDKVSVAMGAGDDSVRISTIGTLTGSATVSGWTVSGGEGTDTLIMSTGSTSITGANLTDFEAVRLTGGSTVWVDQAKNNITSVTFDGNSGSFTGLKSGGTVNARVGGSLTVANTDVSTTGFTATAATTDSLTVNSGTTSAGATSNLSLTATGVETITINNLGAPGDSALRTNTVLGSTVQALTVSAPGALNLTASSTAMRTVTASGVLGDLTYTTASTAGASVTGGAGNDSITGGAGADTLVGGAGIDRLAGGAGNDSLDGGDGADFITGGNGSDTLTGGAGADRFDFATNDIAATTPVTTSTASAFDTITDFTAGTDKINITGAGAPVAFLGNFTNYSTALAATNATVNTGVLQNSAAFVVSENMLYVFRNNDGTANANDMAIRLSGVTALTATDLLIGSQSTGNDITIDTTTVANVTGTSSTGASATPDVTTNTPLITSATTTDNNDTVRITTARLGVAATIAGGAGNDTLTVSNSSTATPSTAAYAVTLPTTVTGFEVYNLPNAQTTGSSFVFVAQNFTNNRTHFISASNHLGVDGAGADLASNVTPVLTIDANTATASQALSITGGAGNDSIRGGAGNDTINGGAGADTINLNVGGRDSVDGGAGNDTITGGAGIDTINGGDGDDDITLGEAGSVVTGSGGSDIFRTSMANAAGSSFTGGTGTNDQITFTDSGSITLAAAVSGTTGLISGIETINLNAGTGPSTLTVTPGQNLTVVMAAAAATIAGTGSTITVTGSAARAVTLSGTSNFVVSGQTTATVSSTATGTLSVTTTDAHTVSASGTATIDVAALVTADATTGLTVAGTGGTITVNGAGTTANDLITQATAFTGALTVNTTSTNAVLFTQASTAASVGAATLNVGGSGAVTLLALANHASQTINLNDTGAVTVGANSTSTAYTITVGGTAGARSYTNSSTTSSIDTYTGGTGVDTVTLGRGGDVFTSGGGNDIYIINTTTDTGLASGFGAGLAALANGTTINVANMDKLSGLTAGFTIRFVAADADVGNAGVTGTIIRNGGTAAADNAAAPGLMMITGTYDAATGLFTVSAGGNSTLLVYDDNFASAGGDYRGVVLVGYVDTGAADTFGAAAAANQTTMTFTVTG